MKEGNTIGYGSHDAFPSGLVRKVTKRLCPQENVLTVVSEDVLMLGIQEGPWAQASSTDA